MIPSTQWSFIPFVKAKGHVVCAELRERLLRDMALREHPVRTEGELTEKPAKGWAYDPGGMVIAWWRVEHVVVAGLAVGCFSVHFDEAVDALHALQQRGPRFFDDGTPYFKLHSRWSCLVLTPAQFQALVATFERRLPTAKRRAAKDDAKLAAMVPPSGSSAR